MADGYEVFRKYYHLRGHSKFPEALILVFQNMRLIRKLCRSAYRMKMYYNKPPNRHVIDREFLASFDVFYYPAPYFRLEEIECEELNDLYSSPDIVRMTKSRRISCAGHVALVGREEKCVQSKGIEGGGAEVKR